MMTTSNPNIQKSPVVVFSDSSEGVESFIRDTGVARDKLLIRTSSPDLFFSSANLIVEDLFAQVDPTRRIEYMYSGGELTSSIYSQLNRCGEDQARSVLISRVVHGVHKNLFKALALAGPDFREPRVIITVDTGDEQLNQTLNPRWSAFLSRNAELTEHSVQIRGVRKEWGKISTRNRYRYLTMIRAEDIFWKISQSEIFSRIWSRKKAKGKFVVVIGSYMLRHVCGHLFLNGYDVECFFSSFKVLRNAETGLPSQDSEIIDKEVSHHFALIEKPFTEYLARWFQPELVEVGIDLVRDEMRRDLRSFHKFRDMWISYLGSSGANAVLTRTPVGPELVALVEVCRHFGIPVIAGQHGVSREIEATYKSCRSIMCENTLADLFLAYNQAAVIADESSPFRFGRSVAVGLSADYSKVSKRRNPRKKKGVLFVSTALLSGNINMLKGGMTDIDRIRLECDLVDLVLGKLPIPVLYKSYHSGTARYVEESYLRSRIAKHRHIDYFDEPLELVDFPIKNYHLILVCRATSTLAWCLMADIPTIVIDVPTESPYKKELVPLLKQAVFYCSTADPNFFEETLDLCSISPAELNRLWASKREYRLEFVRQYISSFDNVSMKDAARCVERYIAG